MSCQICGKATGPGALLCRPCKSALKRARQFTVLELPGTPASVTMPGLLTEARRPAPPQGAAILRARWTAARPVLIGASAVLVLAILAFLGQRLVNAGDPPADHAMPRAGGALSPSPSAPVEAVANPERSSDIVPVPPPRAKAVPAKSPAKIPSGNAALTMRAEAVIPEPAASSMSQAIPELPKPAPAVVATAQVDRWQAMSDALARCAREGGFTGFFCDQRVRLDSCEGYWGQVPQCPLPPENPR